MLYYSSGVFHPYFSHSDPSQLLTLPSTGKTRVMHPLQLRDRNIYLALKCFKLKWNSGWDLLLLQDGEDDRLCDDEAVGIHHAVLATNLGCGHDRRSRDPGRMDDDDSQLFHGWEQQAVLLTDDVVPDLLRDRDGLHRVWRDVLGEDVDSIFFDAWKRRGACQMKSIDFMHSQENMHTHNYIT